MFLVVQYLYSLVMPPELYFQAELDKIHTSDSCKNMFIYKQENDGEYNPLEEHLILLSKLV